MSILDLPKDIFNRLKYLLSSWSVFIIFTKGSIDMHILIIGAVGIVAIIAAVIFLFGLAENIMAMIVDEIQNSL